MFLLQDSRGQAINGIPFNHRHGTLGDDWTTIERLIHKVHGASTHLHAVCERLALGVEPRERRQETGVNIEYPTTERVNKTRRQQPHVSRETNKIHVAFAQRGNDLALMLFAISPTPGNHKCLNPTFSRQLQPACARLIAYYNCDLSIRYSAIANSIAEREHV